MPKLYDLQRPRRRIERCPETPAQVAGIVAVLIAMACCAPIIAAIGG